MRAKETAKPRLVMLLSKGAEQDPKIALAILERRYPKEWGKREFVETRDRTGEPEEVSEDDIVRKLYQKPEAAEHIHALIDLFDDKPRDVGKEDKPGDVVRTITPEAAR
jgi:DNA primase catalytic subunit